MDYSLSPLGDQAVVIELGTEISPNTQLQIQKITALLSKVNETWLIEWVPAFTTVTVFYSLSKAAASAGDALPYDFVCSRLHEWLKDPLDGDFREQRVVEVPICYGGDFGPDLPFVAEHNGLSPEEVIHIHSNGDYTVFMIGFAPGFPFIGGMSERIAAPRKKSPRLKIPARTLGIAGKQTGIYPIETPGGWQLIGRTPIQLFKPDSHPPTLLQAGDKIKFYPISLEEYQMLKEDHS
ncbi:MAG TPA: 5-oxoprolinase subunit PxpB [Bacillaceae bacterium]